MHGSQPLGRRATALSALLAGVTIIAVALVGGDSSSERPRPEPKRGGAINPIAPLGPGEDDEGDWSTERKDDAPDLGNPLAGASFGARSRRKVKVMVSGDGAANIAVYYRDRKKPRAIYATAFAETRNVRGRFPLAAVTIQIPGTSAGVARKVTCSIRVDGVEVSRKSVSKPWVTQTCTG